MKKSLFFITAILPFISFSQTIFPVPQLKEKTSEIKYKGIKSDDVLFAPYTSKKGYKIKYHSNNNLSKEGYEIKIDQNKIHIYSSSDRGKFYANQSLLQILDQAKNSNKLPLVYIKDQPDIEFRGVVEGFYGQPWSHENRIDQLKFYGRNKLNTYIYGPKDDPYHSSPKWRENYPTLEANKLKEMVKVANENQVDFYWAIHPGQDIKWNEVDRNVVLRKFETMYTLGVRNFAVFFDDIAGEGTNATKQADLLNFLQTEFVDKKKGVGNMIMCPTEYNKNWSNPKEGTYLDILGEQLDKRIHVMWTGNTVIHDITKEGQDWVNKRLKRNSFVWWNFPVNDYVRNHLLLGPAYGLDKENKNAMSGFVSNPMDKPEASKVAIFSIANYSWNLAQYDSNDSWKKGIEETFPTIAKDYEFFASHNADPGPSYHQYRRDESTGISDILIKKSEELDSNQIIAFSTSDYNKLISTFKMFSSSAQNILNNHDNPELLKEIKPWLNYFEVQGKACEILVELYQTKDSERIFQLYNELQNYRNQLKHIDATENRGEHQPGIVTASRYVMPWLEKSNLVFRNKLIGLGYALEDTDIQPSAKIITSIEKLKHLTIKNDVFAGNKMYPILRVDKTLEYFPMKPNDFIGLEIISKTPIKEVRFKNQDNIKLTTEYSENGIDWKKDKTQQTKYVRLISRSESIVQIKLNQFDVIFE